MRIFVAAIAAACGGSSTQPSLPPATAQPCAVFDEARGKLVLFGGQSPSGLSGETWTWSGTWARAATSGPSPRTGSACAYDSARQRVVLYGGDTGSSRPGDTWEWDGAAWARASASGPGGRAFHRLAFDRARSRTVLFGGSTGNSTFPPETWEWNGSTWTQMASSGPAGRFLHALSWDGMKTVLFGGFDGARTLGDAWAWDGAAWTPDASAWPPAMDHVNMTLDASRNVLVLYAAQQTWQRGQGGWSRTTGASGPTAPTAELTYDAGRARIVLWETPGAGGFKLWAFDGTTWDAQ